MLLIIKYISVLFLYGAMFFAAAMMFIYSWLEMDGKFKDENVRKIERKIRIIELEKEFKQLLSENL